MGKVKAECSQQQLQGLQSLLHAGHCHGEAMVPDIVSHQQPKCSMIGGSNLYPGCSGVGKLVRTPS